jgi:YD repeat-containing protein
MYNGGSLGNTYCSNVNDLQAYLASTHCTAQTYVSSADPSGYSGFIEDDACLIPPPLPPETDPSKPAGGLPEYPQDNNSCSSGAPGGLQSGSIIECRDQILYQSIPIIGTPFTINYSSSNQPAFLPNARHLKLEIAKTLKTYADAYGPLYSIHVDFRIGSQWAAKDYKGGILTNSEPIYFEYDWDGKGADGNEVPGFMRATVRITYTYWYVYIVLGGETSTDRPHPVTQSMSIPFGRADLTQQKMGSWTINAYHYYDRDNQMLVLGTGTTHDALKFSLRSTPENNVRILSEDASEYYDFTTAGLHLSTTDAKSGIRKYTFEHDNAGRLIAISDQNGLKTTLTRDTNGNLAAITSPYGIATKVAVSSDGYLSEIKDPMGRSTLFTYGIDAQKGLMLSMTNAAGHTKYYNYDASAHLISSKDYRGSEKKISKTTARTAAGKDWSMVTFSSPMGRNTLYETTKSGISISFKNTEPSGQVARHTHNYITNRKYTRYNDGRTIDIKSVRDMGRFRDQFVVSSITKTGISSSKIAFDRTYTLNNPKDPYSMTSHNLETKLLEPASTEGEPDTLIGTYKVNYDVAARKEISQTPSG